MTALSPHKAQWSDDQAALVPKLLTEQLPAGSLVWDPCAGIGEKFHRTMGPAAGWVTLGSEMEPEWAGWNPTDPTRCAADGWPTPDAIVTAWHDAPGSLGTVCADSTRIPDRFDGVFDGSVTSYAFDNRMNDRYIGTNDYQAGRTKTFKTPTGDVQRPDRMNYAAMLGREPSPRNTAGLRGRAWWQITVELLHAQIRAVREGGTIAVELKDATEDDGDRIYTVQKFLGYVCGGQCPGVRLDVVHALPAPGDRKGANRDERVAQSQLIVLTRTGGLF